MDCSPPLREPLFCSALRTFFKAFFAIIGVFLAFLICGYIYAFFSSSSLIPEMTTLHVLPDAEGNRTLVPLNSPAILQINIHGVIGDPKNGIDSEKAESIFLDSRDGLLQNDRVKAILIHFDTPGGAVVDADNIYQMLKEYKTKYKIPVYAYVDGLCASGGMYIASATDKVFAGPASVIGSVGVLMGPFFNISDTLGKIGIQAKTFTRGIDKDMMSPIRPWKEGEDASLQAIMTYLYNRFVNVVTYARPNLDKTKLINEYGAQVYDCVTAQKLVYIDVAMSSRNEALLALLDAAHIDPSSPYQVVQLSPKSDWISQLVDGKSGIFSGKIEHSFDFGTPEIKDRFAYLYTFD